MSLYIGGGMIRSWVSTQKQICDTIRVSRLIAKALEEWQFSKLPRGYWIDKDYSGVPCLVLNDEGFLAGMNMGYERECRFTGWDRISIWKAKWLQHDLESGWPKEAVDYMEKELNKWLGLVYPTRGIYYSDIYSEFSLFGAGFETWDAPFDPKTADRCTYFYHVGESDLFDRCGCEACTAIAAAEKCIKRIKEMFLL